MYTVAYTDIRLFSLQMKLNLLLMDVIRDGAPGCILNGLSGDILY